MFLKAHLIFCNRLSNSENIGLEGITFYRMLPSIKHTNQSFYNIKLNKQTTLINVIGQSILHNLLTKVQAANYSRDIMARLKTKTFRTTKNC